MSRDPIAVWFRWFLGGFVAYGFLAELLYLGHAMSAFRGWRGIVFGAGAAAVILFFAERAERRARRRAEHQR